ncbi:Dbl homology domain-containing protein [Xylariaceae sp. FL0016]|nr:Dbl homology domain-containing protein [Xylariaceae sp. FL0016]
MALVALPNSGSPHPCSRSSSAHISRKPSWSARRPASSTHNSNQNDKGPGLRTFDLFDNEENETWDVLDNITALGLNLRLEGDDEPQHSTDLPRFSLEENDAIDKEEMNALTVVKPFHKWMKNLHRRAQRPRIHRAESFEPFPEFLAEYDRQAIDGHRKSSSGSSFGFVTAVKSATVSLASASVITRPRRRTARSSLHTRTDHSSRGSLSVPRFSEDSSYLERASISDPGVTERLLQRRRILEELISTEESYIGDIKFLMNVYVTILASLPTLHHGLRSSINRNLTDIVELHDEILGDLHRIVPNSEYVQPERIPMTPNKPPTQGHHRWRSLNSVPEDTGGQRWLQHVPSLIAEPNVAAEVAHIFGRRMNRFFVYEEYGAKYEMMIKDIASAHRTLPQWETYQKGLEALAASLGAVSHHLDHSRKSLTTGDLLVKPIQRICRYPLLFAELLRHTPVCDCPNSHMEIESVLIRLREATAEINRATDDPGMKATMQQTWLLQDRLVYPNQKLDATSKTAIRSFGHVRLCGVLHVCWQTREGVNGQYMIAVLYKDCLVLAIAGNADQIYTIQACISLDCIKIEEVDNGRGLQCHTAPFSWKLVFECDHQLYEMILTACSLREEREWRSHFSYLDGREPLMVSEPAFYSSVFLNIKSLGTVFGKPGTVARRLSVHRATTVGPKSPLCQVILRNTSTVKETSSTNSNFPINRSQSLLTTASRVPVLAPSRADRAKLEALLADVWSRKMLPFPGITNRSRSENLMRSSASTMMRKLSVASITSSFTKRSASVASQHRRDDDGQLPRVDSFVDSLVSVNCDGTSPSVSGESIEDIKRRRLPVIRDATERSSSAGTQYIQIDGAADTDGNTSSGTEIIRRRDKSKLNLDSTEEYGSDLARSRPTSAHSHRTLTSLMVLPGSSETSDANQGTDSASSIRGNLKLARSPSKWSRKSAKGAINRGLVSLGSRGIFR